MIILVPATIEPIEPDHTFRTEHTETRRGDNWLVLAATFFAAAVLIHGADHARRGAGAVSRDVFWAGTAALLLEVALVVLACQRHRLAPVIAAVGGFSLAICYAVVHFLPHRSWLSDSFTSAMHASPLSWTAASLEVTAAITLGVVGVVTLRQRGGIAAVSRPKPDQRALGQGIVHPVALAMIVGNVAILAISVTQL